MKLLVFAVRLLLFWFVFFLAQQILFLYINKDSFQGSSAGFFHSMIIAQRMNLSAAMYLISLPLIVLLLSVWRLSEKATNTFIKWVVIVTVIFCCILCAVDIGLYKAWGTKFNAKALSYLAYPKDVLPMLFSGTTLFLFPVLAVEVILFLWLRKKICGSYHWQEMKLTAKLSVTVIVVSLFIIGVRGGVQKIPLNRNQVFFSDQPLLNYAALNSFWNLADLFVHPVDALKNPYPYFSESDAKKYFNKLNHADKDTTIQILKTQRPNVILIFLESWTADVVECLGGEKGVTPGFCAMAKEGMLFTNFYSTGYRTEQGLLAMLSAFPAQPQGSVIYSWGKFDKLPNLFRDMDSLNYQTSFYYGGRLQFDNMEAYLRSGGVNYMTGENDFIIKRKTAWGAYDEELFALYLKNLPNEKQPFFSMAGTLTTHEWWDADVPGYFHQFNDPVANAYCNTVHYSDSCLYDFIKKAQQQSWYDSTLFIIVADHGCRYPLMRSNFEIKRHHIPMLLMGGALKDEYCGTINERVSSHTDIAATLFAQMKIHNDKYPRSKNIFNPYSPEYAYYAFDNGFGLITKDKSVIYDNNRGKEILNNPEDSLSENLVKLGKAFLQCSNSFTAGNSNNRTSR